MEREMININANLIKEPVSTSFFKDGKESQVVNFTLAKGYGKGKEYINCAVYGDKVDVAKTFAKGDFVHVYGYFNHRMKDGKTYTFNGSSLGGKNLVTFEELYDLSNPDEPIKVAEHKDIEDDGQTVLITNRIINIHTIKTNLYVRAGISKNPKQLLEITKGNAGDEERLSGIICPGQSDNGYGHLRRKSGHSGQRHI